MFENKKNHKKYIGQSINITKRKWEHIYSPSPYSKFDDILHQEGEDNFNFSIIEICSANELDEKEKYWITYYDSIKNGYNLIEGGNCYRGQNNIQAKLNDNQVLEIINLLKYDNRSLAQLSRELDISLNILYDINRCRTWKHLHNYKKNVRNEARKEVMPV